MTEPTESDAPVDPKEAMRNVLLLGAKSEKLRQIIRKL